MDETAQSFNLSLTSENGLTNTQLQELTVTKAMSDSQANNRFNTYNNNNKNSPNSASNVTIKTEYSQFQPTQSYYDDRPLPALAKKLQQEGITGKLDRTAGLTAYYEDEFEVYNSDDDEGDENYRLTNKASKNDLKDIIKMCKQQLSRANDPSPTTFGGLDEIREQSVESSHNSSAFKNSKVGMSSSILSATDSKESKILAMKEKVKEALGSDTFSKVYIYLKKQTELGTSNNEIKKRLTEMVGESNLPYCFEVEQIIFKELC